jgi:hypothetical protein
MKLVENSALMSVGDQMMLGMDKATKLSEMLQNVEALLGEVSKDYAARGLRDRAVNVRAYLESLKRQRQQVEAL